MENKKIKILVIDDLQDNLITLNALITDAFPEAITLNTQSGKAGLDLAAKEMPEVILLDILMPGMDGYEVCQKLKADKNLCDIPVVFVTAIENNKAALVKALESGGEAFLTKPIDEIELTAQIRSMLKIKKANDAKKDEKVRLEKLVEERNKELVQELEARKQAENEIVKVNRRLKISTESARIGIWDLDLKKNLLTWDKRMFELYGIEPDNFGGAYEAWKKRVHPDDLERSDKEVQAAIAGEKEFHTQFRVVWPDGQIRFIEAHAIVNHDSDGTPKSMVGVNWDITERKQAVEKLKESEENYKATVENLQVGMAVHNNVGRVIFCNPKATHLLGLTHEQMLGKELIDPSWCFVNEDLSKMKVEDYPVSRVIATKQKLDSYQLGIKTKDRDYITWVNVNANPVFSGNDLEKIIVNFIDITGRKQAEEELRESKLQLESAIKASNTGLWDWDLTNNKVYFSSEWKKQIGYEDHEISSDFSEWQNHVHPDDLKKALSRVNAFLEKPYPNFENEFRFRHKNGSYRWILAKASIIYDKHGKPIRMLGSHLDITERKQAEVKLKESEERYRSLVNAVNSGVAIYKVMNEGLSGSDYIIQDFNQFALKHEMLNKEEVIGKSLKDIRPNIDEYGLIDIFRKVWETGESTYFPAKVYIDEKYSNYYENRVFKLPSGEIVAVYDDVTEREKAELALKESEERFNLAMNASNDGLFDWNLLTNKIYYSPAWKKMIGYEDHEIPNDFSVWETTTAPEDVKKSWELQQKLILKQIDRFMIEFKMKHKDGHWVDILSRAKAIFDEKGKAIRIVGTHTDISERRKADEEIRKIGKHYQALIEKAPDGIVLLNAEGRIKYVSPSALKMFGYNLSEIIPDDPAEFTHPDDLMMVLSELGKVVANADYIPTLIYRFMDKQSNWHWVETTFSNLLANPSVESIVLNFRDITERKQAEQQQRIMAEMLDIAPGSITVHDTSGRFLFANKKTFELHGYSKSEFMSLNLHDLDVPESEALLNERFRKIAETGYASFEVAHFHKDGHIIPMEVFAKKVEYEGQSAVLSIATDITEHIKNEEDLKVSLTKYQVLFDLFPVGITITDSGGNIKETNKIAEKLLGISREEHVRRTISGGEWRIIRPDGSSMPVSEYASVRAIKEGCPVHNIEMGIVKDKNAITWLNVSAEPIPLEGYGVAITYNDITHQKQVEWDLIEAKNRAEENEKKYQSMFNTMQEGVYLHEIIYDDNGKPNNYRIIEANSVSEKYLNIERENAIGKLATELFGVQTAPNLDIYARVAETGEPVLFEQYFEPMNKYFFVSVFSPKRGEFATAFMDITRQKNYENEILAAKEKAEESDRLKSAFLANMSHEIRTPMNGILGFAELLKEPNLSGDEHKKYIQIIEKSGARMLNTINAIVDISKIEAGLMEVDKVEVNINEIMNFVFHFFQSEADSKGIVLLLRNNLTAEQAIIKTDKEKLNAILFNLVKNAIKYTKKGVILFGCSIKPHKNENDLVDKNEVEFFVKDTGIGIPADRQKAVFERFIQADVIDKNAYQGSGLGLSISKAYVEMLGGRIWLKSVVGTGTTFYFTIPGGPHQEYSGISDQISKENYGTDPKNTDKLSLKILVVEDHAPSALYISQIIKTVSKETLLAESGTKAVELCRNNPDLDLVLMDIRMPEMDGYEATRQIRLFNKEILIIVQTAHALAEYRDKSLRAGADAHISKPVNKDELLKLIRSQIRNKEAKG